MGAMLLRFGLGSVALLFGMTACSSGDVVFGGGSPGTGGSGAQGAGGSGAGGGSGGAGAGGGVPASCGDGVIDAGEACDGLALGGADCTALGFDAAAGIACADN